MRGSSVNIPSREMPQDSLVQVDTEAMIAVLAKHVRTTIEKLDEGNLEGYCAAFFDYQACKDEIVRFVDAEAIESVHRMLTASIKERFPRPNASHELNRTLFTASAEDDFEDIINDRLAEMDQGDQPGSSEPTF